MVEPSYLDELTREARRIEFDDGLTDLQTALVFLLLGLINALFLSEIGMKWYVGASLANRELTLVALMGLLAFIIAVLVGSRRIVGWIRKKKFRSGEGQATPLAWQLDRWVAFLALGAFFLIFIPGMFVFPRQPLDMHSGLRITLASASAATAVIYFAIGRVLAVSRYTWVALAGTLSTLLLLIVPLSAPASWILLTLSWVISLTVSGTVALRGALAQRSERSDG
jgi:hypothetical protein